MFLNNDDLAEEDLDELDADQGMVMPLSHLPPAAQMMTSAPRSSDSKVGSESSTPVERSQQYNERLARARMQKNMMTMQKRSANTGARRSRNMFWRRHEHCL